MSQKKFVTITCDLCKLEINKDEARIDASVYGRDFHIDCFENATAENILGLLVDDIDVVSVTGKHTRLVSTPFTGLK